MTYLAGSVDSAGGAAGQTLVWRRWGARAAEILLFLTLAIWSTWPLARHLDDALPLGTEPVGTVPLFNAWTIGWNADRAQHGFAGYWDAPIFYPTSGTFAYSEPQLTTLLVAPFVWLTGSPVLAYNVYLLAALALNGWSGLCVLRRMGLSPWPALCGGVMVELLPFVHWQLGVLQLVPMCGILWTILALDRFHEQPTWRRGMGLGLAFAVTYLMCAYHGLFLSVLLVNFGGGLLGRRMIEWRSWRSLIVAGATVAVLAGPVIHAQLGVSRDEDFRRDVELLRNLSAEGGDYTVTPWRQFVRWPDLADPERRDHWPLGLGTLKNVLAFVGIAAGLLTHGRRRWTWFLTTMLIAAFGLSLGPKLQIGKWAPYEALMAYYPGFAHARNVFRFALFAQLMVALLAAVGLEVVLQFRRRGETPENDSRRPFHGGLAMAWKVLAVCISLATVFDVRPKRQPLFYPPDVTAPCEWTEGLRRHTPSDAVIACVPFPEGVTVNDYFGTTLWMYWSLVHQRRMVNGYSGFFPETFLELKDIMPGFPDDPTLDLLENMDVTYCVVHRDSVPRTRIEMHPAISRRLRWVFGDEKARVDVYQIVRMRDEG